MHPRDWVELDKSVPDSAVRMIVYILLWSLRLFIQNNPLVEERRQIATKKSTSQGTP